TTAEGVETKEQLARLTKEGCNEVQGYFFSPPRPAAEVEHILNEMAHGEAVA
ncbi:MAG TPA: EAL domain-containing protein, partial [Pseudolabrys sp.]